MKVTITVTKVRFSLYLYLNKLINFMQKGRIGGVEVGLSLITRWHICISHVQAAAPTPFLCYESVEEIVSVVLRFNFQTCAVITGMQHIQ